MTETTTARALYHRMRARSEGGRMSESKHTPGPWYPNGIMVRTSAQGPSTPGHIVAECCMGENATADATLIAAAPDLLEAASNMIAHLEQSGKEIPTQLWNSYLDLRAAIARAKGAEEEGS